MFNFTEVYEKSIRVIKERADGSDYVNFDTVFDTRECLLNTDYVVSVHPYEFTSSIDMGRLDGAFPEGAKFCSIVLDGNSFRTSEMIVVGSFEKFCRLLQKNKS